MKKFRVGISTFKPELFGPLLLSPLVGQVEILVLFVLPISVMQLSP